ncbi:hypothetical protein AAEU29_01005 [Pseudoalteromonas sp. SSM20]|uniref:hypothetical protein n=1 Tax=Pseudoalteromonas sp. SSM20 TaxID=3139394 RepID=UPI003BAD4F79
MKKLLSSNELTYEMERLLPVSATVNLISAFVTLPAVDWVLTHLQPQTTICVVGRLTPKDFIDGASDINAIRSCLQNGIKVKALANLHAKIYQFDDVIFHGSANLTGKGLALVENHNVESSSKLENCVQSNAFIQKIVNSAIELNLATLDKMQSFINEKTSSTEKPLEWPVEILAPTSELFVSDFPLGSPSEFVHEYLLNNSLTFAQIESQEDFELQQALFKNSKVYQWLKQQIINNRSERDLGFGAVSKLIHDALADDPAPYRQEIKTLQANLYSYLKKYASDEIEIYMPGRRSEVLRFK